MATVPSIWKEQRLVESFEIDVAGRLKPHMLFAHLLNCAWKHTNGTSYGYTELKDRSLMWVLAKFQLSIQRLPLWGESIIIETWGKGIERFYALRDFLVSTSEGGTLASATSAWMILDRSTRRPQRIDQMKDSFPWHPGKIALETDFERLPPSTDGEVRARFRAHFSDIDVNEHVAAMRYMQWIMDSHPRDLLEEKHPSRVEINFLAEAVMGDEVAVRCEPVDGRELCTVWRASDQKELCRAAVQWSAA